MKDTQKKQKRPSAARKSPAVSADESQYLKVITSANQLTPAGNGDSGNNKPWSRRAA
ncbi:MAG TPA: hypothetical protein VE996_12985 [Terriglobales bacterium]|jgi:hypothetical protein|nr:hypothetical protein [Terriglobales bacterium]